jgi:hypothetical protein
MKLLAIDPGNIESAYLMYHTGQAMPNEWAKMPNEHIFNVLDRPDRPDLLAIEMIASYGMAVGKEVFATCVWIGRFIEHWGGDFRLVYRAEVKMHLTHTNRSKDANVRQALIDKFGPGKDLAIGRKAAPGPLYGLTGDCWSALGVAVTAAETKESRG